MVQTGFENDIWFVGEYLSVIDHGRLNYAWNRVIFEKIGDNTFVVGAEIIDENFLEHLYWIDCFEQQIKWTTNRTQIVRISQNQAVQTTGLGLLGNSGQAAVIEKEPAEPAAKCQRNNHSADIKTQAKETKLRSAGVALFGGKRRSGSHLKS